MALKANTIANHQLASVLQRLSEIRCQDFGCYKRSTLGRRVEQRMRIRKCATVARYCELLAREPAEVDALVSTLLIKLTGFFRDPPLWEKLRQSVLPKIVEQADAGGEIRVWSAGCATGEEAYSIGMLLAELSRAHAFSFRVFGTDRDAGAIAAAGRGRFTREQVRGVSPDLMERWFQRTADGYIVRRDLRRRVVFGVQDLVTDTPISRVDLILCRNLFIYLDSAGQRRSLMHLYRGLRPGRVIVLGKSELLPFGHELFEPVDLPLRIYRKRSAVPVDIARSFAHGAPPNATPGERPSAGAGDENFTAALNAIDTAVVMVSKEGVIALWNDGAARLYGRLRSEVVGQPLSQIKLEGIAGERLLERAAIRPVPEGGAEEIFTTTDGNQRTIRLKVRSFTAIQDEPGGLICLASDVTELHQAIENLRLAQERQQDINTRYNEEIAQLRSSNAELEAIIEELRSANEELQTTNEELQSTNEELEVMNKELQLTSTEFETVNGQLTARSADIDRADLLQQAVMRASTIAVIGVDERGRVNFCNPGAARLFNCAADRMHQQSIQRLSLAPLPKQISSRIKQSFSRKLALNLKAFECAIGADKVKLSCRLTPLTNGAANHGALLIIEPAQGSRRGLQWR